MTVIPVNAIPASELNLLGNNIMPAVERDREELAAWNRSLAGHDEQLDEFTFCRPWQSTHTLT